MGDLLKTYLAQIVAIPAAFVVGYAAKHGLTLDQQQVAGLMIAAYAVVERLVAAKTNPTNAATPKALRASRVMLAQHGEPSIRSTMHQSASKAGPVRKDD
jgi:hypothetical protein